MKPGPIARMFMPDHERTMNCHTCGMLLPAERPVFHPHVYCLLMKAGVRDPETYMRATFPLLLDHFWAQVGTCTADLAGVGGHLLSCVLPHGHEGRHRSSVGTEWTEAKGG